MRFRANCLGRSGGDFAISQGRFETQSVSNFEEFVGDVEDVRETGCVGRLICGEWPAYPGFGDVKSTLTVPGFGYGMCKVRTLGLRE